MTHNICFILLAVDKENNKDPLKIWGLYLSVLAFPGECVNQLGSEVKSIPERSAGWFKTLDVWHRLMLCDIKKIFFLLIWSLELMKPYHKLLHNCYVSSWRPHHPDFEIFDGSRLTQPLNHPADLSGMDLTSDPSWFTHSPGKASTERYSPQIFKGSLLFSLSTANKMKQILCVICFDTKWLSVLFKTVIIQSDDHNVPHYAYKTTAHV